MKPSENILASHKRAYLIGHVFDDGIECFALLLGSNLEVKPASPWDGWLVGIRVSGNFDLVLVDLRVLLDPSYVAAFEI